MLWLSCRSALVAPRPFLRPRLVAVVPLFDGFRSAPRSFGCLGPGLRSRPARGGLRSAAVPVAAAFAARVPGARPGSLAAR